MSNKEQRMLAIFTGMYENGNDGKDGKGKRGNAVRGTTGITAMREREKEKWKEKLKERERGKGKEKEKREKFPGFKLLGDWVEHLDTDEAVDECGVNPLTLENYSSFNTINTFGFPGYATNLIDDFLFEQVLNNGDGILRRRFGSLANSLISSRELSVFQSDAIRRDFMAGAVREGFGDPLWLCERGASIQKLVRLSQACYSLNTKAAFSESLANLPRFGGNINTYENHSAYKANEKFSNLIKTCSMKVLNKLQTFVMNSPCSYKSSLFPVCRQLTRALELLKTKTEVEKYLQNESNSSIIPSSSFSSNSESLSSSSSSYSSSSSSSSPPPNSVLKLLLHQSIASTTSQLQSANTRAFGIWLQIVPMTDDLTEEDVFPVGECLCGRYRQMKQNRHEHRHIHGNKHNHRHQCRNHHHHHQHSSEKKNMREEKEETNENGDDSKEGTTETESVCSTCGEFSCSSCSSSCSSSSLSSSSSSSSSDSDSDSSPSSPSPSSSSSSFSTSSSKTVSVKLYKKENIENDSSSSSSSSEQSEVNSSQERAEKAEIDEIIEDFQKKT